MKKTLLTLIILFPLNIFSQEKELNKIGNVSLEELKMTSYNEDKDAFALYLKEYGSTKNFKGQGLNLKKYYYARIKVLNKNLFEKNAILKISYFNKENVKNIKAITYNLVNSKIKKTILDVNSIFEKDLNNKWKEKILTFPNIQNGSVIEFSYEIITPYYKLDDWVFQNNIPKIQSEYISSIIVNYRYKTRLNGFLKLDINDVSIEKKCFFTSKYGKASCIKSHYAIKNIPAFKEEKYLTSPKNYVSKLIFDLESFNYNITIRGHGIASRIEKVEKNYIKTWKDTDKKLKEIFLNNQTSKKRFFKKKLPQLILTIKNELKKAKIAYEFIKNNYNLNDRYWSINNDVKESFKNKIGSLDEINLSLYNTLQALDIESYPVIISTRANGFPTKLYPSIRDFNYIIIKAVINNQDYFLDATNKLLSFGNIPLKCLNGDGRVMDFEKGSYWQAIKTSQKSSTYTKVKLKITDNNNLKGNILINNKGHYGYNKRQEITNTTQEDYVNNLESNYPYIEFEDYELKNIKNLDKNLTESYSISIENDDQNKIIINPFLISSLIINPFKLKTRDYPVDFGYPRTNTYIFSLKIPNGYQIKKLPENKVISLPNKGGRFVLNIKETSNTINLYSKISINKKIYSSDEYHYLKEFYNQIIKAQDTFIEIEKKEF